MKTRTKKRLHKVEDTNSRKAIRKQKRLEKKHNKHQHYLNKKSKVHNKNDESMIGRFVKRPADNDDDVYSPQPKKVKQKLSVKERVNKELKEDKLAEVKLKKEMAQNRREMLLKANDDENKLISKLEKQLGLKKIKNVNKIFESDGLNYLLEICDRATNDKVVEVEKHLMNAEDPDAFEDDLAEVTGKNRQEKEISNKTKDVDSEFGDEVDEGFEIGVEIDESDFGAEGSDVDNLAESCNETESDISNQEEKEINAHQNSRSNIKNSKYKNETKECFESHDDSDNEDVKTAHIEEKPDVWEDIYGRKRDKEGNLIKEEKGSYIPPHQRINMLTSSDKELQQLKRQIKSILNKLAESNLYWACNSIETLYSNNSRHSVNTALSDLWIAVIVQKTITPERLIIEHAALISVLQANIGMEVGAHFLQTLVKSLHNMLLNCTSDTESKELDNLICALAQLYNFKIFNASLLYEILNKLMECVCERNVGCILIVLRNVGGVLRKEAPLALKKFINETQKKISCVSDTVANGSRIKFLIEVLMAVKNNNLNKIPNFDPSYSEHIKKLTKSIIRKGNYVTTLNIGLNDLLKVDERGKWWIVGSAWEGSETLLKKSDQPGNKLKNEGSYDRKLIELAKKQRMNTDIRRSIFCIIMSAEDYMDAFEKLQHLGLKNQQEREIVHVLLACCLQEKIYNPYYSALGHKLCDYDRKYQLSIQYSVWDKIKDIQSFKKEQMSNLAKFIIHLIMEKCLPISILKVIEFSDLNKVTVKFMRQILLAIIMNDDFELSLSVFQRISKTPKLHMFRESLRLFIQHFLIRNTGKKTQLLKESEMEILKDRALQVERVLILNNSKLRL